VLVLNPGSRRGDRLRRDAQALFASHGLALRRIHVVEDDLDAAVEAAVREAPDLVVIAGGDGTIGCAVDRLAHRDVVLGVLPTGTTNNFARTLGIPLDLDGALDVLESGVVARVDLGVAGHRRFANVATLGVSVEIAHAASPLAKRLLGRAAYGLAGLRSLLHHEPIEVVLETEDGERRVLTHELIVANGRFHSGVLISEDVRPDDQRLVVFHLGDRHRLALLRSLVLFALRRPRTLHQGNVFRVSRARVTAEPPQALELDGEIRTRTPIDLAVDREALQVMVPPAFLAAVESEA
jgi:YegS/Rv2252/BmrU family lipid kinase